MSVLAGKDVLGFDLMRTQARAQGSARCLVRDRNGSVSHLVYLGQVSRCHVLHKRLANDLPVVLEKVQCHALECCRFCDVEARLWKGARAQAAREQYVSLARCSVA